MDGPRADRFIAAVTRPVDKGLPDVMTTEVGDVVVGGGVLEGAREFILSRDCAQPFFDAKARSKAEEHLHDVRRNVARELRAQSARGPSPISADTISDAMKAINVNAGCKGIPYAALVMVLPESREWHRATQGLAMDLGEAYGDPVQDIYHVLKPGKPRGQFSSFRTLSLNPSEGRLQDEVWAILADGKHIAAAGNGQDAHKDNLATIVADASAASIRQGLGLPLGFIFTDRWQAFTSSSRAVILTRLYSAAGITGRLHSVADDQISRARARIIKETMQSSTFSPRSGVAEGRKNSPPFFCVGQAALSEILQTSSVEVGLNPPMGAVLAFHAHRNGTDDAQYDVDTATDLYDLILDKTMSWDTCMQSAPDDTTRLLLLDLSSTISRGLCMVVDDARSAVNSHGHAVHCLERFEHCANQHQYRYNSAKSAITADGFCHRRAIPFQGGSASYVASHVAVGFNTPGCPVGFHHLSYIVARSPHKFNVIWSSIVAAGLPFSVFLIALERRVLPSAAYACELTIHGPQAAKVLNRLQSQWFRKSLGLALNIPRIVLMYELGIRDRLSAVAWLCALALRNRLRSDPRYSAEDTLCRLAETQSCSWAAKVADLYAALSIPFLPVLPEGSTRNQIRAACRECSREVLRPAIDAWEARAWKSLPKHVHYWDNYVRSPWTAANLSGLVAQPLAIVSWAQLKLQGFISPADGSPAARDYCAACGGRLPETATHLFLACPVISRLVVPSMRSFPMFPEAGLDRVRFLFGFAPSEPAAVQSVLVVHRAACLIHRRAGQQARAQESASTTDCESSDTDEASQQHSALLIMFYYTVISDTLFFSFLCFSFICSSGLFLCISIYLFS
jgi:hypothetical protein